MGLQKNNDLKTKRSQVSFFQIPLCMSHFYFQTLKQAPVKKTKNKLSKRRVSTNKTNSFSLSLTGCIIPCTIICLNDNTVAIVGWFILMPIFVICDCHNYHQFPIKNIIPCTPHKHAHTKNISQTQEILFFWD